MVQVMSPFRWFGLLLQIVTAFLCASCVHYIATEKDWSRVPNGEQSNVSERLPHLAFTQVLPSEELGAVSLLEKSALIEISPSEARQFVGEALGKGEGKIYLVRGLYYHHQTGAFRITGDGTRLFVHHGSLGREAPIHKTAIAVRLRVAPSDIYVWASLAE